MHKLIHALLIDFHAAICDEELKPFLSHNIVFTKAHSIDDILEFRSALIPSVVLCEYQTYIHHAENVKTTIENFLGPTIVVGRSIEINSYASLYEYKLTSDNNFIVKALYPESLAEAVHEHQIQNSVLNSVDRYNFIESLIDKLSENGAHEFNTPMNVIFGTLQLLNEYGETIDAVDRKELINSALRSCARMRRAYGNLLISVRAFKPPAPFITIRPVSLAKTLERVIRNLNNEKDIELICPSIDDVGLNILEEHLYLLLYEIIDNSVKFGDNNIPPLIKGSLSATEKFYRLSIRDYGSCSDYSFVRNFGAFIQLDRDKNEQQGWGLGLFIAKQITNTYDVQWEIIPCNPGTVVEFTFKLSEYKNTF